MKGQSNYYYLINTPLGDRFCCFSGTSDDNARLKALFACFYDDLLESEAEDIRKMTTQQKRDALIERYAHRIKQSTKEIYEKYEPFQID